MNRVSTGGRNSITTEEICPHHSAAQRAAEPPLFFSEKPFPSPSFSQFEKRHFFAPKWFYLLNRTTFFLKIAVLSH